jgi:membrane protein DedA with SNARE-associated domain
MSTRPSITTLAIVGLISLAALAAGTLVDLADVAAVLQRITAALGPWTYAVVAVLVFLETVALAGLVSPGEATLAVGGAAAAQGEIALVPLLAVVWTAGVLGDLAGHALGRRYGWALVGRSGERLGLDEARLQRLDGVLARWGGLALVGGRFVGLVRAFAPFAAGASGMARRSLLRWSIAGVGVWGATFVLAGYAFADSLGRSLQAGGNVALALAGAVAITYLLRRRAAPSTRTRFA